MKPSHREILRIAIDTALAKKPHGFEAKLADGKGEAYRRWATVENLKRMAKTKLYMNEHGLANNRQKEKEHGRE